MSQTNAAAPPAPASASRGARIVVGTATYNEIAQFLYEEAALLDERRLDDWVTLLAEDLSYTAPLRSTRAGADQSGNVVYTTKHFDDDYSSILGRLGRLKTKSAWAEDPPSRTRRLITNILVHETARPDEFAVTSYLFLARSRHEHSEYQFMSAVRNDILRRSATGYRLARREIIIDQSVVGMSNFSVFL
jgi:3-phenylpropionate/cinnamic acid dioxygenase small subunit